MYHCEVSFAFVFLKEYYMLQGTKALDHNFALPISMNYENEKEDKGAVIHIHEEKWNVCEKGHKTILEISGIKQVSSVAIQHSTDYTKRQLEIDDFERSFILFSILEYIVEQSGSI